MASLKKKRRGRITFFCGKVLLGLCSLLLASCLSLEMKIGLAGKGSRAQLEQTLIQGEELMSLARSEEIMPFVTLPWEEEDFLAALHPFPGAKLESWQREGNFVRVHISFNDNGQLVDYLNQTGTLGSWQLAAGSLKLSLAADPESAPYFADQHLKLSLHGPRRYKSATHALKRGRLELVSDLAAVFRDGLQLEVSW